MTDTNNVDDESALGNSLFNFQLSREAGTINLDSQSRDIVLKLPNQMKGATFNVKLGEGYEFEPSTYLLTFTTIAISRIRPLVYIQSLGA